ncbi:MAG: BspA family leucine-rich repeat surface protein [Bacteroidota bacterium]
MARRLTLFAFLMALGWSARAQFITTWKTDNPGASAPNQVAINRGNTGFYNIAWVDVNNALSFGSVANINTVNYTLTLPTPGTYRISITGAFTHFFMGGSPDAPKLLSVEQWGTTAWTSFDDAFATCSNVVINATDVPNLSSCTSLHQAFEGATSVNAGFKNWDVSNIQDFSEMFAVASSFNDDISGWNTSNATNMNAMFGGASSFNRDISSWNVSNVTNMRSIFGGATVFNQNINTWDVSNVTNMQSAFAGTDAFNQPLNNWNMGSVTVIDQMFMNAKSFNQDIGGWNVSNVTTFTEMFSGATVFNQDISSWNMSNCILTTGMFELATAFNQNIGSWNLSNNTDMSRMFNGASSFSQEIGSWDVSNVTGMYATFQDATFFNSDLSSWNTGNVVYMSNMFAGTALFDRDITGWNVSNVTDMSYMFYNATGFNQNIMMWNVANVTNMANMFSGARAFNQNIGNWEVGLVTDMTDMLVASGISTDYYDAILISWAALPSLQDNVPFGASSNYYCLGESARASIIASHNWVISDLGKMCPPTIVSFTPTFGPAGTSVTITGTNLSNISAVLFGATPAASYTINSSTSITAIVGTGETGAVYVYTPAGSTMKTGFFFLEPPPTITSFSPTSAGKGAIVTITGINLAGTTALNFGGTAATSFSVISSTTIKATVGTGSTGVVSLATLSGTAFLPGFTYIAQPAPTITAISPVSGGPGTRIDIFGDNFDNATSVTIGGIEAASFSIGSTKLITAFIPATGASGNVVVTTPGGIATYSIGGGFTFVPAPTITSFSPTSATEGTTVTITGTDFTNASQVEFGGAKASSFIVVSPTTITAVVSNFGATGDVSVATFSGVAFRSGFTFLVPKIIVKNSDDNTGTQVNANDNIDLGTTFINEQITKTVSLTNNGNVDGAVVAVNLGNPSFSVVDKPTTVAAGSFALLTIAFNPTRLGAQSTNVTVTLSNGSLLFRMTAEATQADIEVFNAVTPNGDGAHDFFKIKNIEQYSGNRVVILDRIGNEVFRMTDYDNSEPTKRFEGSGNNGNGKSLTDGTYYYVIDLQTSKKYTGFLLLQR